LICRLPCPRADAGDAGKDGTFLFRNHVAAASQHRIRPTTKQGHTRRLLDDKIVYDAATNSGGSGALLFNRDGKVIGMNFSVLRDFGGSNLALRVKYAKDLLK
jgi:S1-C subfamily serine protease